MPFTSPGSLTTDEYILAEANVIDKVTVLDARTLPAVQMPKREGFVPDPRPELFK
jgi:S-disulfanyl-L-cysteine oxidoreductase SoxD